VNVIAGIKAIFDPLDHLTAGPASGERAVISDNGAGRSG